MAWSCSFLTLSSPARVSQLYRENSRMAASHPWQMTILPERRAWAVRRTPSSTRLSAASTRQPAWRRAAMKLAADGSTTTWAISRPPASRPRSATYSLSVFCRPSARAS